MLVIVLLGGYFGVVLGEGVFIDWLVLFVVWGSEDLVVMVLWWLLW